MPTRLALNRAEEPIRCKRQFGIDNEHAPSGRTYRCLSDRCIRCGRLCIIVTPNLLFTSLPSLIPDMRPVSSTNVAHAPVPQMNRWAEGSRYHG
ncbi:hypothetical protein VTO73DRAFT_13999 [Trametes versicolor]